MRKEIVRRVTKGCFDCPFRHGDKTYLCSIDRDIAIGNAVKDHEFPNRCPLIKQGWIEVQPVLSD